MNHAKFRKLVAAVAALAVLLLAVGAAADPSPNEIPKSPVIDLSVPIHVLSPSELITDGGAHIRLPPGYFLTEPLWDLLNAEVGRLQEAETRLMAENKVFRESKDGGLGWILVTTALSIGIVVGAFAF